MKVTTEAMGEVLVVHLSGKIDYETVQPFHAGCVTQLKGKKVIFDLASLDFVGSSGITDLVQTFTDLKIQNTGLKLCGVGPEFRRVFAASAISMVEIYEDMIRAKLAYDGHAVMPLNAPTILEPLAIPEIEAQLNDAYTILED